MFPLLMKHTELCETSTIAQIYYYHFHNSFPGVIQSINFPNAPDDDIYCEYVIDPYNKTENFGLVGPIAIVVELRCS